MGPGDLSVQSRLHRHCSSWDARNGSWTHSAENQLEYAEAVSVWSAFHDSMLKNNNNRIGKRIETSF